MYPFQVEVGSYIYRIKKNQIILLIILSCFTKLSIAQQYQFQNFSVSTGLGQSQVFCLLEDSQGYIWMGTRGGGLSRYDGVSFTQFNNEKLTSNYIWSIVEDPTGTIWVGTDNSLMRFDGNQFVAVETPFRDSPITCLRSINSELWIGSTKGLMVLRNGDFQSVSLEFKGLISSIELHNDLIWIGSDAGLVALQYPNLDSVRYRFNTTNGLNADKVRSLYSTPAGLWVGTYGGGVNLIHRDSLSNANDFIPLENARVHSIIEKNGDFYFATQQNGLCRFVVRDTMSEFITDKQGLANNHVRSLLSDSWGNLWVGTSGGGVSKFQGRTFDYFKQENGLDGDYIYALEKDCVGKIWVSTSGNGLTVIDQGVISAFEWREDLKKGKIKAMHHALDSSIWLGYDGGGVARVDTDTVVYLTTSNGLKSGYIRDFVEDGFGNIWIATAGGGVCKVTYSNNEFTTTSFDRAAGLPSVRVNQIHLDRLNRLWFATVSGGVGYIQNDSVQRIWNTSNGLADNDVVSIVEDQRGYLWVGTARSGVNKLSIYKESIIVDTLSLSDGLSSNICYQLVLDEEDNLWIGSERGVEKLTLDINGNLLEMKLYGYDEGFQGVETTQNASLIDDNGDLWFGSIDGLSRFNGSNEKGDPVLPIIHIDRISINSETQRRDLSVFFLPYDSNRITIDVIAISQYKSSEIRYKHRIIGLNDSWSDPTSTAILNYAGLNPGKYRIEVIASIDQNTWTKPVFVDFRIDKPVWEKTWFIATYVSLSILIIWLLIYLRLRAIRSKLEESERQLKLQKEVLELEQKALRLQMNPHFIFNALNSIQAMISKNDPKTARLYLAKFSKLMRQVLDNSRQPLIPLERELEALENYLSIERFCHRERFNYSIEVSDQIDIESIQIPPIMIQPFVENAIVHGVSQIAAGGKVALIFGIKDDLLVCTIIDNGIGRQAASQLISQQGQKHRSTALLITQERLDQLNGSSAEKSILIEDLLDDNGVAQGTKVTVKIKIKQTTFSA